ncbi:hypothetical protein JXJ21_23750 [candidate division KSB1 bacterium]|nr:hypothetical protein [candidate division KSB1 bacterium]
MYLDFYEIFQGVNRVEPWSIDSLATYFNMPAKCFAEVAPGVILVIQKWAEQPIGYLMRGSIFFVNERIAVRGMPKIMYGRVYQEGTPAAVVAEQELLSCLKHDSIIFEEKLDGVNIRMYCVREKTYFATRMKYDGYSEKGDFIFGNMARDIVKKKYPGAYELAASGDVPIFEMLSPRFDYLTIKAKQDDLFLIDVLRQNKFLQREEKEELAQQYHLKVPRIISKINRDLSSKQFLKEVKRLEHYAHQLGIEGVVAKAFAGESDQVFLKVKTQDVRTEHWGTMGIPRRFIVEAIRNLRAESTRDEFVNRELALDKIVEELADDFIITEKNTQKIEQYYNEEYAIAKTELDAINRAESLLKENRFKSKKELALATKSESTLVRHFLFKFWTDERLSGGEPNE